MMGFQQTTKELNTYRVLVLCAIVILLEGFDIQAAGVSAPKLTLAFNLDPFGKGMFLGASAVGIFIASILGGFLADKYGRKPIVVSGVIIFIHAARTGTWNADNSPIHDRVGIGIGNACSHCLCQRP
jgi:AAHS family 3-hydroxyphenylpropionic acid transporter